MGQGGLEKAPDAFRTISEVADDLDVPQHVLRFWESRFSQIRPMKRGGGRRYYRPDDVALLRGIRHLLYGQGYTIRGVQRILREQGIRFVQGVWQDGAEQPQRSVTDDIVAAEDVEALAQAEASHSDVPQPQTASVSERREPTFGAPEMHPAAAVPASSPTEDIADEVAIARPPPDAASAETAATAVDREALLTAFVELAECRRLLEAALQDPV
jgi:DNA-binding transcriptional MerR regulator